MNPLYGVLFSATARTLLGELHISPATQRQMREVKERLDLVADLVGDLSPLRPATWPKFMGRYLDHAFSAQQRFGSARQWLRAHHYGAWRADVDFIVEDIWERLQGEVVFRDNFGELREYILDHGVRLALLRDPDAPADGVEAFCRGELDRLEDLQKAMAGLFWQRRRAILLDIGLEGPVCRDTELGRYRYRGQLVELIEHWRDFSERGLRRHVLLQGPPGCGKSTLCLHAARELSRRTVILTADYLTSVRMSDWTALMATLRPDMVIVDDIDRIGTHNLETRLRMFEEGTCEIPYVLFTSNDHTRLPAAMRRPGRIDQIIVVDEPDSRTRRDLIREMATRVGVEVPDMAMPTLMQLLEELSAAHVMEALRRAHVHGWDFDGLPGDVTFDAESSQENSDHEGRRGLRVV